MIIILIAKNIIYQRIKL